MIKVSIDSKQLEQKLKKFSKQLNKSAEDTIIEMAQLTSKQLAIRTEPYGLDGKAESLAKLAIYKDISLAYDTVGQTFNTLKQYDRRTAYAFARCIEQNDLLSAERYARKYISDFKMRDSDSNADHLESVRAKKGRVQKQNESVMGLKSDSEYDNIKEKKELTAGLAKAAWLQAGKDIQSKTRIPKWLKKSKKYGYANVIKRGWNTIVNLHNKVPYINNVITDAKIKLALKNAYTNKISQLKRKIDALAKNF